MGRVRNVLLAIPIFALISVGNAIAQSPQTRSDSRGPIAKKTSVQAAQDYSLALKAQAKALAKVMQLRAEVIHDSQETVAATARYYAAIADQVEVQAQSARVMAAIGRAAAQKKYRTGAYDDHAKYVRAEAAASARASNDLADVSRAADKSVQAADHYADALSALCGHGERYGQGQGAFSVD
jgi:hypothetical protein